MGRANWSRFRADSDSRRPLAPSLGGPAFRHLQSVEANGSRSEKATQSRRNVKGVRNFLKHSLAHYNGNDAPRIAYGPVKTTSSPPGTRAYGAAGAKADADRKAQKSVHA